MQVFRDAEGTTWKLSVHFGNLPVIKQETGVRLALIEHPIMLEGDDEKIWIGDDGEPVPGITRLFQDVELVFDIMFCLLSDQAEQHNVNKVEFAKRLSATGVQQKAFIAFWDELRDFFLSTRKEQIAEGIEQYTNLMRAVVRGLTEEVTSTTSSINESMRTKKTSGERLDMSESTREGSPTGSLTG